MTVNSRRRQTPAQPSVMSIFATVVVSIGLLILAVLALWLSRGAADQRQQAEQEALTIEVFELRMRMAWLHHELLTDGLSGELSGTDLDQGRVERFQQQRRELVGRLTEISNERGPAAASASESLALYDDVSFDSWPFDAFDLEEQHYVSVSPDDPDHGEIVVLTMLPSLVYADALAVRFDQRSEEPPMWASDYLESILGTVTNVPGWLGPDRERPFDDNFLMDPEIAVGTSAIDRELSSAGRGHLATIWDYDQWLIAASEGGFQSEPPVSIDELTRAVTAVNQELRPLALESLRDSTAAATTDIPGTFSIRGWLAGAVVCLLGSIASLAVAARRMWGSHRVLSADAFTDALTGAWNRRYLEKEVRGRCQQAGYHHVVVMIDLDLFKMVNDTWGHDVGDRLLEVTSNRLQITAEELGEPWKESSVAVVRAGGDEFIVALHAKGRFELAHVAAKIRALAGPVDLGREEPINLEFSVGIADSDHPIELDDLLKSADLAAYEDKRERAARREGPSPNQRSATPSPMPETLELR